MYIRIQERLFEEPVYQAPSPTLKLMTEGMVEGTPTLGARNCPANINLTYYINLLPYSSNKIT